MGFSLKKMFSGSGWRKFKGAVGGALSIATSVIPGVGGLAGKLLAAKGTLGGIARTANKGFLIGKAVRRGKRVASMGPLVASLTGTAAVLKASPVMPGGGIATPSGVVGATGGTPPRTFGGARAGTKRRKKRTSRLAGRLTRRRKKRGPRFGSPAWRKKYHLDSKRRRKRR